MSLQLCPLVLQQNKQLMNLHKQIMQLYENYKECQSEYRTKIKYGLKEMAKGINVDSLLEREKNVHLSNALMRDDLQHERLDENFNKLMFNEYINGTLIETSNKSEFIEKGLAGTDDMSYRQNKQNIIQYKQKKPKVNEQFIGNLIGSREIRGEQLSCQLLRQRQINQSLFKQVQLLQKENTTFAEYYNQSGDKVDPLKSQIIRTRRQQEISKTEQEEDEELQNQVNNQSLSLQNDQQLHHQISCLNKLIHSKSIILNQIQSNNYALRLRTNQLNSKQLYLSKKKSQIQIQQTPKLQKRLNNLISQLRSLTVPDSNIEYLNYAKLNQRKIETNPQNQTNQPNQPNLYNNPQKKLNTALSQAIEIKHLINTQLQNQINQSKNQFISNQIE